MNKNNNNMEKWLQVKNKFMKIRDEYVKSSKSNNDKNQVINHLKKVGMSEIIKF